MNMFELYLVLYFIVTASILISQKTWFNNLMFFIRFISVFANRYFYLEVFEEVKMDAYQCKP